MDAICPDYQRRDLPGAHGATDRFLVGLGEHGGFGDRNEAAIGRARGAALGLPSVLLMVVLLRGAIQGRSCALSNIVAERRICAYQAGDLRSESRIGHSSRHHAPPDGRLDVADGPERSR